MKYINFHIFQSQYAYIYNCIKQVLKNPYFLKTCKYHLLYITFQYNFFELDIMKTHYHASLIGKPPPVSPVYQNISKKAKEATNSDNNLVNNLELCM